MKNQLRQLALATRLGLRLPSASRRKLPDFLIIGAMKSGTTSLLSYLNQHPQVQPALKKEIGFFNHNYEKRSNWYKAHFPMLSSPAAIRQVTGEASTGYLYYADVPDRIHSDLPTASLIALLRNPVDRAVSEYFHRVRTGKEKRDLVTAMMEDSHTTNAPSGREPTAYMRRGLYAEQLKPYFDRFPQEQLLILESRELFQQPESSLRRTFDFLRIDPSFQLSSLTPRNVGGYEADVPHDLENHMKDYFRKPNQDLTKLVGRTFWT